VTSQSGSSLFTFTARGAGIRLVGVALVDLARFTVKSSSSCSSYLGLALRFRDVGVRLVGVSLVDVAHFLGDLWPSSSFLAFALRFRGGILGFFWFESTCTVSHE